MVKRLVNGDINMSNRKIAAKRIKERYGPFDLLDDDDSEYYEELVQSLTEWLDDGGGTYTTGNRDAPRKGQLPSSPTTHPFYITYHERTLNEAYQNNLQCNA